MPHHDAALHSHLPLLLRENWHRPNRHAAPAYCQTRSSPAALHDSTQWKLFSTKCPSAGALAHSLGCTICWCVFHRFDNPSDDPALCNICPTGFDPGTRRYVGLPLHDRAYRTEKEAVQSLSFYIISLE